MTDTGWGTTGHSATSCYIRTRGAWHAGRVPTIAEVLRSGTPLETVASTYPLDEETIAEHASVLDWEALCRNPNIRWTEAMLERFAARLDWYHLTRNPALPWTVAFVEQAVALGHLTWSDLRWQPAVVCDPKLCELVLPHWLALPRDQWCAGSLEDSAAGPLVPASWHSWGGPEAASWAHPLVERMPEALWTFLGAVDGFPWTIEFIAKHADRLDWRRLSWNPQLPWTIAFVRQFADRIEWDRAVFRIPWTAELARELKDRIDWRRLAHDRDFPWTPELIEELAGHIYWARPDMDIGGWEGTFGGLVQDERLQWTPERFERLRGHLEAHFERVFREDPELNEDSDEDDDDGEIDGAERYWTAWCATGNWSREMFDRALDLEHELGMETIDWTQVSRHARTPWTDEFVAQHADKLVVWELRGNKHFPFARHLHRFADRLQEWDWKSLSSSASFEPTAELLETYGDRLDWQKLSSNPKLSPELIARYGDRWDWDQLAKNDAALTADVVATMADRIPARAWSRIAKRFPTLAPAERRSELLAGRREKDVLDDAAVRDLLTTAHMARSPELEAAIDRAPNDRNTYRAYADWLRERRDPQGDLIALMLERSSGSEVEDAIARYRERLELGQVQVRWRFGFIDELYEVYKDWKRALGMRVSRFLRGFSMTLSTTGDLAAADLAVIAQQSWLERLSLAHAKLARYDALAALAQLRDLRLDHAPVRDLGFLAAFGQLEILGLWNTGIDDTTFAGVRHAKRLRALHTGHNPITDAAPLADLRELEELDIRFSKISDLTPLEQLPALRRLAPEASAVSQTELARFTSMRPDVEITHYKDWPGASVVLPFTDSKSLDPMVRSRTIES